jgi:4-amino-4-deoxy-L-arabinose transferase-like glycosyltransferase
MNTETDKIKMGKQHLRLDITLLVYLLIVIGGILLRVYQIDYNLDGDEIFSVRATSSTFSHMTEISIQDRTHPPLHNILLFFWIRIWGSSEISVRMLSVLASLLFLLVLYRMTLLLMPKWPALFVLSICAFSSFFVYYGQQARPYSLACLFATLTVYLLLRYQTKPSSFIAVSYFFSCVALVYTQYMGVLILLPQFVAIILSKTREQRKLLPYGLAGVFSITFWLILLLLYSSNVPITRMVGWIEKPTLFSFVSLFLTPFDFLPIEGSTKVLVALIALLLSFIIIRRKNINRKNVILLCALALLGPLIAFTVSHFWTVSVWALRQMIGPIIFFICLLALALALIQRWLKIPLGLILVVWTILNVPNAFPENSKIPLRSIANLLSQKYPSHDVIVQTPGIGEALGYYSNKEISCFNKENLVTREQSIYVSHPFLRENLEEIRLNYRILETQTISWGRGKEHTIRLHLLEKKK